MAFMQRRVAVALGNAALEAMTLVHLVYADVQVGNFRRAMRLLRLIGRFAASTRDSVLSKMVESGRRFCRRTYELWAAGLLDDGNGGYQGQRHADFVTAQVQRRGDAAGGQGLRDLAGSSASSHKEALIPPELQAQLQRASLANAASVAGESEQGAIPSARFDELYRLRLVRGGRAGGAIPAHASS